MNLIEALQAENEKSRQHLSEIEETEGFLGPSAGLGASKAITKALIAQTEAAIASGDVLQMIAAARAHGIDQEEGSDQ